MRKRFTTALLCAGTAAILAGCGQGAETASTSHAAETTIQETSIAETAAEEASTGEASEETESEENAKSMAEIMDGAVHITLSDDGITVDGEAISENTEDAVYAANDIIYYEEGKDFKYGEGTEADEHSKEEADAHTVVHITKPGTYALSGQISAGQIAIDLGEEAEEDPEAVVNLVLNGVEINCSVAPGVIFYNVYECGEADEETAVKDVDTTAAGANVYIADDTVNHVNGSYVARIYKSVELNEEGTEVVDSKKLHKYDGAFYSKMTMNVNGGEKNNGVLNILAENEGLDSELHLTINGGVIHIESGNDGINTNEDNVSVTTVNDGTLTIRVNGETGEGDGIDSNGWLVFNGGTVITEACAFSADAGIDADLGIHINGGTLIASGNMLDRISESEQNYAVFSFDSVPEAGEAITLKDAEGNTVITCAPENEFRSLILSDEAMTEGTYTLWAGDTQLSGNAGAGGFGGGMPPQMSGGRPPEGFDPENLPEGFDPENPPEGFNPENFDPENPPEGFNPENPPENLMMPENFDPEDVPEGQEGGRPKDRGEKNGEKKEREQAEVSEEFLISAGGSYFSFVGEEKTE